MAWWLWVLLGLLLLAVEMLTPGGFFALFFGLGALALGGLVAAGVGGPVVVQWLLFSALSIASLALLRPPLLRWMGLDHGPAGGVDSLIGEMATLTQDLAPGAIGKAELRGAAWSARNAGTRPLRGGERARVEGVEGLMLALRPQ